MPHFSFEQWLGILGVVIGIPGLLALWFQRRPNTLDYRVTVATKLLSPAVGDVGFGLEVSSQGVKLLEPFLLQVRVQNTGRHAIRADDYVEAVTVKPNTQVAGMTVVNEHPQGVIDPGAVTVIPGTVEAGLIEGWAFRPQLLNPKDWFEVQMLCEGQPTLGVSARWANQSRIMRPMIVRNRDDLGVIWFLAVFSEAAAFGFAFLLGLIASIFLSYDAATTIGALAWVVATFTIIFLTLRQSWRWHRGR